MEEKKKRGCNYTPAEKEMLLELIKKYQNIIENKETNATMILKKRHAWDTVCLQYNALAMSGSRTWQQLRHLYENLKQRSKKNIAKENRLQFYETTSREVQKKASIDKKEINRTGGGSYKSVLTEQDAQILAMAAPQIQPLPNCYDDAAVYFGDAELEKTDSEGHSSSAILTFGSELQTIDHEDTTVTVAYIPDSSKNSRLSSADHEDTTVTVAYIPDSSKNSRLSSADHEDTTVAYIPDKCKNSGLSSAGRVKPSNNVKQQYFRTKLRNARLETKYLLNKNKMEINKYKIEMQILKLRLQKLKRK